MFRMALCAIAFAIIGLGAAAPAHADALVENATKLWTGDLRTAYDQTVSLLDDGKTKDAKAPAAKLHDLAVTMAAETARIREQAAALAPELGAAWTDTEKLMTNFSQRAIWLKNAIGTGKLDLNPFKSDMDAADEAFEKSVEFTKAFGKSYGELVGGPVESAKELFDGYLNEGYEKTMEYLEAGNTNNGKPEIDRLVEIIAKLYTFTGTASSGAGALARQLQALWKPAHEATYSFQEVTQDLSEVVEDTEYDLGDMESAYDDLSETMAASYNGFLEFGNRLGAISDDWR